MNRLGVKPRSFLFLRRALRTRKWCPQGAQSPQTLIRVIPVLTQKSRVGGHSSPRSTHDHTQTHVRTRVFPDPDGFRRLHTARCTLFGCPLWFNLKDVRTVQVSLIFEDVRKPVERLRVQVKIAELTTVLQVVVVASRTPASFPLLIRPTSCLTHRPTMCLTKE